MVTNKAQRASKVFLETNQAKLVSVFNILSSTKILCNKTKSKRVETSAKCLITKPSLLSHIF